VARLLALALILATPEPKRYRRLKPPPSIVDPFKPVIDAIYWMKNDTECTKNSAAQL
jgi:hypothetical protein